MAFGGTASVVLIRQNLARISGITLGGTGDQSGTIGGAGANVQLPAGFPDFTGSNSPSGASYFDQLEVRVHTMGDAAATGTRIDVEKTRQNPLLITLTCYEPTDGESASVVTLDVYVQFHAIGNQ